MNDFSSKKSPNSRQSFFFPSHTITISHLPTFSFSLITDFSALTLRTYLTHNFPQISQIFAPFKKSRVWPRSINWSSSPVISNWIQSNHVCESILSFHSCVSHMSWSHHTSYQKSFPFSRFKQFQTHGFGANASSLIFDDDLNHTPIHWMNLTFDSKFSAFKEIKRYNFSHFPSILSIGLHEPFVPQTFRTFQYRCILDCTKSLHAQSSLLLHSNSIPIKFHSQPTPVLDVDFLKQFWPINIYFNKKNHSVLMLDVSLFYSFTHLLLRLKLNSFITPTLLLRRIWVQIYRWALEECKKCKLRPTLCSFRFLLMYLSLPSLLLTPRPESKTWSPRLEVHDLKSTTWSPWPEVHDLKSMTWSPRLEVHDLKSTTWSPWPEVQFPLTLYVVLLRIVPAKLSSSNRPNIP